MVKKHLPVSKILSRQTFPGNNKFNYSEISCYNKIISYLQIRLRFCIGILHCRIGTPRACILHNRPHRRLPYCNHHQRVESDCNEFQLLQFLESIRRYKIFVFYDRIIIIYYAKQTPLPTTAAHGRILYYYNMQKKCMHILYTCMLYYVRGVWHIISV